jgi:hypothetical protein
MKPVYTNPATGRNPLFMAELELAPAFAHVVAFSITYEAVASLCSRTFSGSIMLLGPSVGLVAVFVYAEAMLLPYSTQLTIPAIFIKMMLWVVKLFKQIAVLFTANMVARLTSSAVGEVDPTWGAVFVSYMLVLVYCAGRTSGVIK